MDYPLIYLNSYTLISRGTSRRTATILCKPFACMIPIRHYLGRDHFGQVIKENSGDTFNGYKDLHVYQMHTGYSTWTTKLFYLTCEMVTPKFMRNLKLVDKHTIIEQEAMASTHKRRDIYNISSLPFGLESSRTYTQLSLQVTSVTFKRSMMVSSRVLNHVTRAIYHCAEKISHDDLFKAPKSVIPTQIADGMVNLALNPQTGIPQHHTKIMRHLIGHQFRSEDVFNVFIENLKKNTSINIEIFKNEPHTLVDARFINEITSVVEYTKRFHMHIDWLLFTNDARPASFPHQHQSNQDFWVMLKTMQDPATGFAYKCVPQDEKSGGDMFHSCRGSLGTLTYENDGTLVPFMNHDADLKDFNIKRIRSIQNAFNTKEKDSVLHNDLEIYKEKFNAVKNKNNIFQLNDDLQSLLWNNIQRIPLYNRSMSFIFTRHVGYHPFNEKQNNFTNHFKSLLVKDHYDLDNAGDCREIYRAMTIAYTKNVDSQFAKKMMYLHHEAGFKMNSHFLHEIAKLMKDGLL